MSAYTLNTRSSLQTKLHLTATGQSFTKTFRLLALVGVKSLTIMPAIWLIQSAFCLVGWHFQPDEDGKMAETTCIVPLSLSFRLRVWGLLKKCVSQCWQVTAWGWTARCGRPPLLLPSCGKLEFRLSALMDSDLAWVNGKSGRQSWRYADAFQCSIISEAIYNFYRN